MPYAKSSTRARWGAVMTGAVPALFGAPAVAQAACPPTVNSKPFQRFGDYADYSLAPGGSFESGSAGWAVRERVLFDQLGELWIHGVDVALTPVALVAALGVEQRPWTVLAMPESEAVAEMRRGAGGQFDAHVLDALLAVVLGAADAARAA